MRRCIGLVLLLLSAALPLHAQKGRSSSSGTAHVRGYTTKSGKVVAPYERRASGAVSAPKEPSYRAPAPPRASAPRSTAPRVSAPRTPSYRSKSAAPRSKGISPVPGARDANGRLKRSASAKNAFMRQSGHARGWPGHVVDHIVPLACGGADSPSNMQWQATADAKAKDKYERRGCSR